MPIHNSDIADMFEEMADLLEIQGANPFRVRSYRDAARTVSNLSRDLSDMVEAGEDLTELSDIGESIADKITQVVETGRLEQLEELEAEVPPALRTLMRVEGLGPKRTATIWKELGVESLDELEEAAEAGRIRELEGLGEKTEQKILQGVDRARREAERTRIDVAEEHAESLVDYMRECEAVGRVVVAGSYRRRRETVGDLDVLVTCEDSTEAMEHFVGYDDVVEVVSRGDTRSTVYLHSRLQVDVRVVAPESYGAALHYFTGSKAHNIACRQRGLDRGYKINEYGVFEGDEQVGGETEAEIYEMIEMDWVPPEMREDRGEIAAAAEGHLPDLIELDDMRGDLQSHTTASDGAKSLEEMAEAAAAFGHDYFGVTDHSKAVTVAGGLEADELREQMAAIDALNDERDDLVVLKGCEVDILADGTLDLGDDVLAELDFTVCSVHSRFELDRDEQTDRIVRAMDNPHFKILGHPTGRMLGKRDGYALDMDRLFEAAAEREVVLELNAQPRRLDLKDVYVQQAKELGIPLVISTDAHHPDHLTFMRFGIDQARRGWLEAGDVVNTKPLDELLEIFDR